MISALLVAAVAQCGPGGCPSPIRMMPYSLPSYQPAVRYIEPTPVIVPQETAPPRKYDWHRIKEGSLSFPVWGTRLPNGMIEWDIDLPANIEQREKAIKAAEVARKKADEDRASRKAEEEAEARKRGATKNYGIDTSRLSKRERWDANSPEAIRFVRESKAKGDQHHADRCYVTVIGTVEECRAASNDWKTSAEYDGLREKAWFQEFRPGQWQVRDDLGYHATGTPTVLVQKSDGEVVLRENSYRGPGAIATALRKADPSYKPERDPGPDQSWLGCPIPRPERSYVAVAIAFAVAMITIPKRRLK